MTAAASGGVVGPNPAAWFLTVGDDGGRRRLALGRARALVVGSGPEADVRLRSNALGPAHVAFELVDGGVRVTDLGSDYGTWLPTHRVASELVADTTLIRAGNCHLKLERCERPGAVATGFHGLVGTSPPMLALYDKIRSLAPLSASVLISGESGTGKDLVARAIHTLGRATGPFVAINVGGLTEALADSELFGHQRGAFTGAVQQRDGAFVEARGGTLFLDEVADLSPQVQVKLLRAIENKEVRSLGSRGARVVDCRVISACWADLEERASRGDFRLDLYHRLATVTLAVPPLRARKGDIGQLSELLLSRHGRELGCKRLEPEALARLAAYSWPGNVRELSAVLYRAAAACQGETIGEGHIHGALPRHARPRSCTKEDVDVRAVLRAHDGNISAAARAAGLPRSTFRSRLGRTLVGASLAQALGSVQQVEAASD